MTVNTEVPLNARLQPSFIEVETDTFCNRTCAWCPNGHSSRGQARTPISDEVWQALLSDLSRHRYAGWFAFHNYNEPLATPRIFELVESARVNLPSAKFVIYTNGDYRRNGEFDRLVKLGVNTVRISLYPPPHAKNPTNPRTTVDRFLADCFPDVQIRPRPRAKGTEFTFAVGSTKFALFVPDIDKFINRATYVPIGSLVTRKNPCFLPNFNAAVDVWGNLKLCCHMFDVSPQQEAPYLIGNVAEQPFMDLWTGQRMNEARKALAVANFEGLSRCAGCNYELPANFERAARIRHRQLVPAIADAEAERPAPAC